MTQRIERTHVSASNDHRYNRGDGPRDRSLRVGDQERDAVGEILRRRHVEGRLDTDEFQTRIERCMAAKTYAELDELITDLPPEAEDRSQFGRYWSFRPWQPAFLLLPLAPIAAIVVGGHIAWLAVPLFFFFAVRPLVWRAWGGGYGGGLWGCGPRRTTRI